MNATDAREWTDEDMRRVVAKADADILAGTMRDIAEALRLATGTYLTYSQVAALATVLGIEIVANGKAALYTIPANCPTVIEQRAGTCELCGYARTPSNAALHGAGKCWPTARPVLPRAS